MKKAIIIIMTIFLLISCITKKSDFTKIDIKYEALSKDVEVEVILDFSDTRAFQKIGIMEVNVFENNIETAVETAVIEARKYGGNIIKLDSVEMYYYSNLKAFLSGNISAGYYFLFVIGII